MKVQVYSGRPIPDGVFNAALAMADDNLVSLSKQVLTEGSPIFGLARAMLLQEIGRYLDGVGQPGIPFHLIAAALEESAGHRLVGFMVFTTRLQGDPSVAGMNYAAVAEPDRRKGVLREMMATLKSSYPIVALTCSIENVQLYERLGFYPTGARGTHITMENAPLPPGQTMCVDMDEVEASPLCQREKQAIRDRYGAQEPEQYAAYSAWGSKACARVPCRPGCSCSWLGKRKTRLCWKLPGFITSLLGDQKTSGRSYSTLGCAVSSSERLVSSQLRRLRASSSFFSRSSIQRRVHTAPSAALVFAQLTTWSRSPE